MDLKVVKELMETMGDSKIEKFELEIDGLKIKMEKNLMDKERITPITKTNKSEDEPRVEEMKDRKKEETVKIEGKIVRSPIVGTFYRASNPDADPFIRVGDQVKKGNTLCIIEAMKVMNEIDAEEDGEILEILVEDDSLVEYGQPLFRIG